MHSSGIGHLIWVTDVRFIQGGKDLVKLDVSVGGDGLPVFTNQIRLLQPEILFLSIRTHSVCTLIWPNFSPPVVLSKFLGMKYRSKCKMTSGVTRIRAIFHSYRANCPLWIVEWAFPFETEEWILYTFGFNAIWALFRRSSKRNRCSNVRGLVLEKFPGKICPLTGPSDHAFRRASEKKCSNRFETQYASSPQEHIHSARSKYSLVWSRNSL